MTLQRPPPLILTLERSLLDFSMTKIFQDGCNRAVFIAAKIPAAPPPITTKSYERFPTAINGWINEWMPKGLDFY